jgi:hypothetical protein
VADFTAAHDLKPHWVTTLRKAYPTLFPERTSVPRDGEQVEALAAAWDEEVRTGDKPAAAFMREHRLQADAMTTLRRRFPGRFAARIENGAKGQDRIAELAQRWKEEVETGELSVAEFCAKHDITASTINYHRQRDPSLFPAKHPHRLPDKHIETLSRIWDDEVRTGKVTSAEFFATQPISLKTVGRIRKTHPDLFTPLVQRTSEADARALDRIWRAEVLTGRMTPKQSADAHDADATKISYLRTRFPELFPRLRQRATE